MARVPISRPRCSTVFSGGSTQVVKGSLANPTTAMFCGTRMPWPTRICGVPFLSFWRYERAYGVVVNLRDIATALGLCFLDRFAKTDLAPPPGLSG